MPFNGNGSFSAYTPGNPAVTGSVVSSTAFNNTVNDISTGLSNTLTRDGQSPATANIPMGANKITGLANGTAATDAAAFGQFNASSGASIVGFIQSGTGAVARTVQDELRETVKATQFGFSASASYTVNDAALTAAFIAADTVILPPGAFDVSQVVFQSVTGKRLVGAGVSTVLRGVVAGTSVVRFGGSAVGTNRAVLCGIENLVISATAAYTYGIEFQFGTDTTVRNVHVSGVATIDSTLYLDNSWDNDFYRLSGNCLNGLVCGPTSPNRNSFFGGKFDGASSGGTGVGINISGTGNSFYGFDVSSFTSGIKSTYGFYGLSFNGGYFEGNVADIDFGTGGDCDGAAILGVAFAVGTGANIGVRYNSTGNCYGVLIRGCSFKFKTLGIQLGAKFNDWDTQSNNFTSCTTSTSGAGTNSAYETGVWTPTIVLGSGSVTYTTQTGTYTKVGRLVTAQCLVTVNVATAPASSLAVGGLPYAASAGAKGAVSLFFNTFNATLTNLHGQVNATSTNIALYWFNAGVLTNAGAYVTNGSYISVTVSYEV